MVMFVGEVKCPTCGTQHITDPKTVTIWFNLDAREQLIEVRCPKCSKILEGRIDLEDFQKFTTHPINIIPLNNKFKPLTVEDITAWDIDNELSGGLANLI